MKRSYIIGVVAGLLLLTACGKSHKQEAAMTDYNRAEQHYLNNRLDSALMALDELQTKYPKNIKTKQLSNTLKMKIDKEKAMLAVDSISELINEYNIEILKLERANAKEKDIRLIQQKIDSLEDSKKPFWTIYNDIRDKEYSACPQCVVRMQQAARGHSSLGR